VVMNCVPAPTAVRRCVRSCGTARKLIHADMLLHLLRFNFLVSFFQLNSEVSMTAIPYHELV
jgi:hypothetical protein